MEGRQKKERLIKSCITAGTLLLALLYVLILKLAEDQLPNDLSNLYGRWLKVLVQLGWTATIGVILILVRDFYRKGGEMRKKITVIAGPAIVLLLLCIYPYTMKWYLHKVLVVVWPLLVYTLAGKIYSRFNPYIYKKVLVWDTVYYFGITVTILIMENFLVIVDIYKRDPIRMIYLLVTGISALWLVKQERRRACAGPLSTPGADVWKYVSKAANVLLSAASAIVLFRQQPRVEEILKSFSRPLSNTTGERWQINWLGYRLALAVQGWKGDFSMMKETFAARIPADCPLAWIHTEYGIAAALIVLVLLAGIFYGMYRLVRMRREERLPAGELMILCFALLFRSVLALAANLFLITSSDVCILMMGNSYDAIPLLFVLFSGTEIKLFSYTDDNKRMMADGETPMANKYLIVVDMQKDFVDGALGSREAEAIVPALIKKVEEFEGKVIFTYDTHHGNYMKTQEGQLLPVEHCIEGTEGWCLIDALEAVRHKVEFRSYKKPTFGCVTLAEDLRAEDRERGISSIELVGVCTDICVVSNALLLKAYMPEVPISVDSACCAGVTPEKHEAALETMRSCQITVK